MPMRSHFYISFLTHALLSGAKGVGFWKTFVPGLIPGSYTNSPTCPKSSLLLAKKFSKGNKSRRSCFHEFSGAIPNVVPSNLAYRFYFSFKLKFLSQTPNSSNLRSSSCSSGMFAHKSSKVVPKTLAPSYWRRSS